MTYMAKRARRLLRRLFIDLAGASLLIVLGAQGLSAQAPAPPTPAPESKVPVKRPPTYRLPDESKATLSTLYPS